ncbi:DUF262 domain-containing protein [Myceligenerans xiligouense]|uniref:GmrSD restriction endonucleases N-terminal domain-containing protein n=1 Tax=Myceligenerans xiligouense TaxID=253184 RepID=A0A3N4YNE8_9MICO|nr:DUF262 domain-containing protein [Myceligenerans xiligouense]RPF20986.1 hypothetical protein EDD34_1594 [Myceligenerans xiligouense]
MGFETPEPVLRDLVTNAGTGKIQLPDFQRSYRWDDDRIRELLVTVVRGHPMGVLMLLVTGSDHVHFQPRPLERVASDAVEDKRDLAEPEELLLDGQQRMTSLYQALTGSGVVETIDVRKKHIARRYFLDVALALGSPADQDAAVRSLPADGILRTNFDRDVELDVSSTEKQVAAGLMPFTSIFNGEYTDWLWDYGDLHPDNRSRGREINALMSAMLAYKIPAIRLDKETTKEAVATVFNKVNQGGLRLDNFELLTAIFAGDRSYFDTHGEDFRLRDDWALTKKILEAHPVLSEIKETDFLQMVLLLASLDRQRADLSDPSRRDRPRPVTGRGDDVLDMTLEEYLRWAPQVRGALPWTAHFYTSSHIHTKQFLPYRTQSVPLTVFRVLLGEEADLHSVKERLRRWYWCGVLGELYGSTTETRFARDTEQVPGWAHAAKTGAEAATPRTVQDARFSESRLWSLQSRNSAAYKGIYALMLAQGPHDWRHDLLLDNAAYFDLQVDIHHIFPKKYCEENNLDRERWNSVVNKTPLAKKTNIWLGGRSPEIYTARLERDQKFAPGQLDDLFRTHLVDPVALRAADFDAFFTARQEALVAIVEKAMGKPVFRDLAAGEPTELPASYDPDEADDFDTDDDVPELPDEWHDLSDIASGEERIALAQLARSGAPRPAVGFEADGIPVGIGWPDRQIATDVGLLPEYREELTGEGWKIFPLGDDLETALRRR